MIIPPIVEHGIRRVAHKSRPWITNVKSKAIDTTRCRIVNILVYVILLCAANLARFESNHQFYFLPLLGLH